MENHLILDERYIGDNLAVSFKAKNYLVTISNWGKFLAILGFVFSGLAVFGSIAVLINLSNYGNIPGLGKNFMLYIGLGYLVFAFIYGFLSYLLFSFCSHAKKSVTNTDSIALEKSLNQLKKIFIIMGVSTIVFIALYAIFMIAMVAGFAI